MAHRRMKSKSRKARRGEKSIRDFVIRDFERFGWKVPKSWRRAASQEKRRRRGHKRRRTRKWIQKAVNPKHKGALHRQMKWPVDKKIPISVLRRWVKASKSWAALKGVMPSRAVRFWKLAGQRSRLALKLRGLQKRRRRGHKRRRTRKWIQKAVNPKHKGLLHLALGVPMDRKIPMAKLRRTARMPGTLGRLARFALKRRRKRRGGPSPSQAAREITALQRQILRAPKRRRRRRSR